MRVGLLAGSHGDIERLDRALTLLSGSLGCEQIYFLGDDEADLDAVREAHRPSRAAPAPIDSDLAFLDAVTEFMQGHSPGSPASAAAPGLEELLGVPLLQVPERGSRRYQEQPDSRKLLDMLGMSIVLAIHFKGDLVKEDIANAAVILHGDSDEPAVVQIGPRVFVTPGRLRGDPGRMAVLEDLTGGLRFVVLDPSGQQVSEQLVQLRRTTKFTAK